MVLDETDEFDDEKANVYFIMTGNYKVQSLMFNMQRKRTVMEGPAENPGIVDRSKQKIKTKGLRSGDMFGEVSIIFGCRRTATVKAKQYCESAFLTHKDFNHIIANHTVLKNFLVKNILANYDDELRIFLTSCLKEISYLSNLSEEIIVHISMMMIADTADKDSYLINANDSFKQQDDDVYGAFMHDSDDRKAVPLMIIYDGQLCMSIKVDSGTELPLAYVSRGAILNSTNFLVRNTQNVSAQCLTSLTYYYLPYRTLHMLAGVYTELRTNLQKAKKASQINQMLDLKKLDMLETHYDIAQKIQMPAGLRLSDAQKRRVPQLKLLMKNAALHYLCQLRKSQKNKSLTSILEKLSQKAKRRKTETLQMRKEM